MKQIVNVAALLALSAAAVPAGEPAFDEYRVKGAFLLNFAKFVEWPPQTFKGPADPISICILGANPFSAALEQAAREASVEGRPLVVRQIPQPQQAKECQMVFVSAAERKRMRAVLDAVKDDSVLSIGESEGFLEGGGVIEFRIEDERVRMDISREAAKRARLRVSARLLSLAQSRR